MGAHERSFMGVGHHPQALWLVAAPFSFSNLYKVITHSTLGYRDGVGWGLGSTWRQPLVPRFPHRDHSNVETAPPQTPLQAASAPDSPQPLPVFSQEASTPSPHPQSLLGSLPAPHRAATSLRTKDTKTLGDFWQLRSGRPENGREADWETGRAGAGVWTGSPQ